MLLSRRGKGGPMDLYQIIKRDHQKAKRLFERLGEAIGEGGKARDRLFAELKHELEIHTELEEKYFYPALRDHDEAESLIEEALEEHGDVKEALATLDRADRDDPSWAEQIADLDQDVEHHVEEEENEIFPLARRLLDERRTAEIARSFEQAKAAAQKTGD